MKKSKKPIIKHLPDYLDWIDIEKGLASSTQENYARFLKRFFKWLEKHDLTSLLPHELTEKHVWDYRIFLARKTKHENSDKNLEKSTQQYYLIGLRSLLSYFAARDITSLPPEKIELPKTRNEKEIRFLNLDQVRRLFDAPDVSKDIGLRDRAILETLFSTGMRISELVALNRDQIESSLDKEGLELSIIGKGSKARTVYFSPRALEWLRKYLKSRDDMAEALFINYRAPSDASRRLTARSIQKKIKKYAIKAGLPTNTTPHVLRHSFATDLLGRGVDIRILQEFLGHSSITATQIYAHVTSKQLKDIHREYHGGNDLEK
ncbi:MAG: tyrosine-type recombinase/integrase [Candidatus Paceibacterota bacterium]